MSQAVTKGSSKPVRVVYPIPATDGDASPTDVDLREAAGSLTSEIDAAAARAVTEPFPARQRPAMAGAMVGISPTLHRSHAPIVVEYPGEFPRWIRPAFWWLAGFVLCCAWDRAAWLGLSSGGRAHLEWLEPLATFSGYAAAFKEALSFHGAAIGRALIATLYTIAHLAGRPYPWLVLAVIVIFRAWMGTNGREVREGLRRGVLVSAVPALAGGLAEVLKLIARRERPEVSDGWYSFRSYSDRLLIAKDLGLASSDVAIAVGAALVIGMLYPRSRWYVWPIAIACSVCRVLVGAHFVSDVYAAATIAAGAFVLGRWVDRRLNPETPIVASEARGA